ncbi:MAG: hypothetical protein ABSH47_19055 [Bryobacteraceae bacterium]|jgi:hypothetical protein
MIHLGYVPDELIISHLARARESIRFVGPGLSAAAARVLAERWQDLGPYAVEVVLEADADLCRMGYCDGPALRLLLDTARRVQAPIHRQTGVRLCVLEIDGERIIFPPTPRLVEESESQAAQVILAPGQGESLHEQILAPRELAPRPLTETAVQNVTEDLKVSPAQPFDLARQVRVLSTKFQFVEFSLHEAALSRKRVAVPPDLLGLASDAGAEELLRASFQLVAKGDEISGDALLKRRDAIDGHYLVSIPNYGKIIQQSNRADFDKAVDELREEVKKFRESAKQKLDAAINKNCADVIARLLPAVKLRIPTRWRATLGSNPSDEFIRRRLEQELKSAYRNADAYLGKIEIRLIYKDITVEMLRDEEFAKAAEKARLYLAEMYEEYQAARARE